MLYLQNIWLLPSHARVPLCKHHHLLYQCQESRRYRPCSRLPSQDAALLLRHVALQVDVAGLIDDAWAIAKAGRGRISPFLDLIRCATALPARPSIPRQYAEKNWYFLVFSGSFVMTVVQRLLLMPRVQVCWRRRGGTEYSPWTIVVRHLGTSSLSFRCMHRLDFTHRRALARRGGAEYSPWTVASRHLGAVQAFLNGGTDLGDCAQAWTAFVQKKVCEGCFLACRDCTVLAFACLVRCGTAMPQMSAVIQICGTASAPPA